ncbi:conserved hypothetical protein [Desulfosarcina cetonica]|uniref:YhbY family RNA-binding protein n=1 Tax=Desulfosarcina cetonica TaxID=90730 RepID=UPI0006CF490B|nr:YhbY family RNA-binding protein [Desulfosarcina cetonica]VTR65864.1 conserved hypothetical protein [Desulfosarcina cetonica]
MERLQGFQKRYLRGLAHGLKPVVYVGQRGLTPALVGAMNAALDHHELVKVKFIEFKEKEKKQAMVAEIEKTVSCEMIGLIGHMATFFRRQADPEKRKIDLPRRAS